MTFSFGVRWLDTALDSGAQELDAALDREREKRRGAWPFGTNSKRRQAGALQRCGVRWLDAPFAQLQSIAPLRAIFNTLTLFFVALLLLGTVSKGQAQNQVTEGEAKQKYIVVVMRYTTWPESAFPSPTAPFVFGVLGENHYRNEFNQLTKGTVQKHPINVKMCSTIEEAKQCHLVFVSSSEKGRLKEILAELKTSEVMTIGETESFTNLGGRINLTLDKGKVKCEISKSANSRAKFKVGSEFMQTTLVTLVQ